jgi:hypothetical protein
VTDASLADGAEFVASLRRGSSAPDRVWFWLPAWSLSYNQPPDAT